MSRVEGRLLIVSHVLVHSYQGRHYLKGTFGRLVDAFARRFDEVWLLTCAGSTTGPLDEYYLRESNIVIIPVPDIWHPSRPVRYMLRLRGMLYATLKLSSAIRGCDVIHPRLPSPIGAVGALAAKFVRKPTFVYMAGDHEEMLLHKGPLMRPIAWAILRCSRFLTHDRICFTAGLPLARKFGGPSDQVIPVVPTARGSEHIVGTADALRKAEKQPQEVLFVGAVGEAKGVDILLQAIGAVRDQGKEIRLRIIGDTHDGGTWLRQLINSLELQEVVIHQGYMAWDRVVYEYDKSDIFVLPSRSSRGEGVPNVVLEAMSRGVPVIASSVGGVPWIVQHGINGLLVKPGSPAELAQAILTLLGEVDLRKRLALGGLEVARKYVIDNLIDGMVEKVCLSYGLPIHNNVGE